MKNLVPASLGSQFLDRLAAAADETSLHLSAEDEKFERALRTHIPRPISTALFTRLEKTLSASPFAVDGKIVLFHKNGVRIPASRKIIPFPRKYAAAAAVAILGSLTALMIPSTPPAPSTALDSTELPTTPRIASPVLPSPPSKFVSATYSRQLGGTRDEGVFWPDTYQPHRIPNVDYTDHYSGTLEQGKPFSFKHPDVNHTEKSD